MITGLSPCCSRGQFRRARADRLRRIHRIAQQRGERRDAPRTSRSRPARRARVPRRARIRGQSQCSRSAAARGPRYSRPSRGRRQRLCRYRENCLGKCAARSCRPRRRRRSYRRHIDGEVVVLRWRKDLRQRRIGSEKDAGAHHDPPVMPHFPFGTAIIS